MVNWELFGHAISTNNCSWTFATTNFLPLISIAVTAVEPPLPRSADLSNITLSVVWYAFLIAFSVSVQQSGYNLARGTTRFFHQREKEMWQSRELPAMVSRQLGCRSSNRGYILRSGTLMRRNGEVCFELLERFREAQANGCLHWWSPATHIPPPYSRLRHPFWELRFFETDDCQGWLIKDNAFFFS